MAKQKKDGEFLHCYIRADLMARLNSYLDESRLSKTVATELAIEKFLNEEDKKKQIINQAFVVSKNTKSTTHHLD